MLQKMANITASIFQICVAGYKAATQGCVPCVFSKLREAMQEHQG
jgi:hypothetical protein